MSTAPAVLARPRVLADLVPAVRSRDIALVLGGALLTAAVAQISIPVPGSPVPITGATFAVLLVGAGLGANRGGSALALYMLMGLVGLPFYADGGSGWSHVWGATGGYIVGYIPAAYITGWMAERRLDRTILTAVPAFVVGSIVPFLIGVPWLAVAADYDLSTAIDKGFTPFILGGIVKAAFAAALLPTAWKLAGRGAFRRH
jgi:biotin transport system substrate-specific component